ESEVHKRLPCFTRQSPSPKLSRQIECQHSFARHPHPIAEMWIQATSPHIAPLRLQNRSPHRQPILNRLHRPAPESLLRSLPGSGSPANISPHLCIRLHRTECLE